MKRNRKFVVQSGEQLTGLETKDLASKNDGQVNKAHLGSIWYHSGPSENP